MRAFVGAQPIFDRQQAVHGYELLFRSGGSDGAELSDPERATSEVIAATFADIGVECDWRAIGCPDLEAGSISGAFADAAAWAFAASAGLAVD